MRVTGAEGKVEGVLAQMQPDGAEQFLAPYRDRSYPTFVELDTEVAVGESLGRDFEVGRCRATLRGGIVADENLFAATCWDRGWEDHAAHHLRRQCYPRRC
jgi:hypothetical protein